MKIKTAEIRDIVIACVLLLFLSTFGFYSTEPSHKVSTMTTSSVQNIDTLPDSTS